MSAEVQTERGPPWAVKNALKILPALCLPRVYCSPQLGMLCMYIDLCSCVCRCLLCMCVCIHACVHVCLHTCMSVHVEAKNLHCCSSSEKDLSLAWDSRDLCLPPQHWDSTPTIMSVFLHEFWRSNSDIHASMGRTSLSHLPIHCIDS